MSNTDTSAEAVDRLAHDCDLAKWALMPTFPTGQSILSDSAKTLRALAAERDALRDAYTGAMEGKRMWKRRAQTAEAERDALQAKLDEAQVGRVTVKPLEWRDGGFDHDADLIDTTETYQIKEGIFWYGAQIHGVECAGNESAKAAAQADYERRILSALSPAPVTVSEAARVLDEAIGKNQIPQKTLDIFNAGMPVTALRAIQEQNDE